LDRVKMVKQPMKQSNVSYISLFSGAGGLDLGLERAGWRTAYASDNDAAAVATLRANVGYRLGKGRRAFEDAYIEQADIRLLEPSEILAKSSLLRGNVELLAGGPPCQSWSSAGLQLGFNDPRGRLFDEFLRVAKGLDARWLILENVRGLVTARGPDGRPGSALQHIRRNLLHAGYQTTVALLNAADFGVPQRRVRLIMIGFRQGDAPVFPDTTHAKQSVVGKLRWLPLECAIGKSGGLDQSDIIRPTGKMAIDLADVPPGSGVKSPGKAERTRPGGHWGYKQGAFVAALDQSARTVTASTQQDWIRDPELGLRRLCPKECAAIQSFPPEWQFVGPQVAQYRLIGNAVPPLLAQALGRCLLSDIKIESRGAVSNFNALLPLPDRLAYHVDYTAREEASNGASRRASPARRSARSDLLLKSA
jgi:DNA (cytosine-5)-methyltransferase 1